MAKAVAKACEDAGGQALLCKANVADDAEELGAGQTEGFFLGQIRHQIEQVGEKLRAMMPWIKKNKLVDQTRN